jgi:hypothetical protein
VIPVRHGISRIFGHLSVQGNSCYKRSLSIPLPLVTASFSLGLHEHNATIETALQRTMRG